jgi:hypothetical protein
MEEPMNPRRHDYPGDANEHQPAEERVQRREQLAVSSFHPIDWPHPAEDHRRVEERIDTIKPAGYVIAERTATHGAAKKQESQQEMPCGSP